MEAKYSWTIEGIQSKVVSGNDLITEIKRTTSNYHLIPNKGILSTGFHAERQYIYETIYYVGEYILYEGDRVVRQQKASEFFSA